MMHGREKSDSVIVAEKPTNKAGNRSGGGGAKDGDQGERGSAKHAPGAGPGKRVTGAGARTASRKATEEGTVHRALAPYHGRPAATAFYALKRDAAPGVDGVTWQDLRGRTSIARLEDLHATGPSAERTGRSHPGVEYIPKEDGRQRPLAVAALEDKIVQRATAAVLNAIYEEDFLGFCVLQRQKKGDGKKSRKAAWKMREGPSRSAFRSRSQTTPSRCG